MENQVLKIIVYGFYGKNNAGDDLFVEAFQHLFPNFSFIFTDNLNTLLLQDADAVFFGGGSFLEFPPKISVEAVNHLTQIPIFYIGVGAETKLHPIHLQLLAIAKLIVIRNLENLTKIKQLNRNTYYFPDLVYYLQEKIIFNQPQSRSILFLPNFNVVPQWDDFHWKHTVWEHFKNEIAQAFDLLLEQEYQLSILPMSDSSLDNDYSAGVEIINRIKRRNQIKWLTAPHQISALSQIFSAHQLTITQRYHGIVLSEMTNVPYISLSHHDKMNNIHSNRGKSINYYNFSKNLFLSYLSSLPLNQQHNQTLSIKNNNIGELRNKILSCF